MSTKDGFGQAEWNDYFQGRRDEAGVPEERDRPKETAYELGRHEQRLQRPRPHSSPPPVHETWEEVLAPLPRLRLRCVFLAVIVVVLAAGLESVYWFGGFAAWGCAAAAVAAALAVSLL